MYRNKEVVHSGEAGEGVCFVINGIVKVACVDLKDTQDYFLGSGEPCCLSVGLSVCLSVCLSACLPVCLAVCLSVCLSICLSVCWFVSLSVQAVVHWHDASTNG